MNNPAHAKPWIYHELASMDQPCPNLDCLAPTNEYCRRPDGPIRRVPCVARTNRSDNAYIDETLAAVPGAAALKRQRR